MKLSFIMPAVSQYLRNVMVTYYRGISFFKCPTNTLDVKGVVNFYQIFLESAKYVAASTDVTTQPLNSILYTIYYIKYCDAWT